ncbi:type IV pilus modification PilV family protein [Legionella oakridgensis]|uniref:Prepilin-type N-terminal cleavage/methylation domain protein n=2 Tax=Legionella oakridgensis TaxID=29423 RepID=W0B9S6_9GAMM|nr:hypothetical protein [Legionella oakridgensis]AHE66620.1 hypothetical protein Loa_01064 [Legionella oakridgensis ATCC 33761 = DSM 21215]ETO93637.1 hypothetical protein LOR_100c25530 [Legionella oakridgensis RV-2-2007]KTD37785.1 hypothetical protein Loak_1461 [Legionella oakridgensis]STY19763.1 Tfp pilus assembly protein PilV [Legionella longbeachae]
MNTECGFSMTEVLVSLLLMTTTSLALLKQQWISNQRFNQIHLQTQALMQLDSASEQMMAGEKILPTDKRFKFIQRACAHSIRLSITWDCLAVHQQHKHGCRLQREWITG